MSKRPSASTKAINRPVADDTPVGIAARDDTAGLLVVEHHVGRDLAIGTVAHGHEAAVVVVDHGVWASG